MVNETSTNVVVQGVNFLSELFRPLLTKFVVAVIIILAGLAIGRVVGKLVQKILSEIELDKLIKKATGIKSRLQELIGMFVTYFIYFIAIVMALGQLGLETYILHILSGAVLLLIVLSIFLGIKDFVPNVMAGMLIHRKGFLKEGDKVQYKDVRGKIIHLNLVETRIETKSGDIIYVPNSLISKTEIKKLKRL